MLSSANRTGELVLSQGNVSSNLTESAAATRFGNRHSAIDNRQSAMRSLASSNGQDDRLSIGESGFDSPREQ